MHAVIKAVEEGIPTSQAARDNGVPKTLTRTKALISQVFNPPAV